MKTNQEVLNKFMIDELVINPITNILDKLNNRDFRDCDIPWLNKKLDTYVNLALEVLNIKITGINTEKYTHLNDFVIESYTNKFQTLLNFFKKF